MLANDYGILYSPFSTRNPQDNVIVERIHHTISNIIHTFTIQQIYLDNENPWEGILSSNMFTIRSLVHIGIWQGHNPKYQPESQLAIK